MADLSPAEDVVADLLLDRYNPDPVTDPAFEDTARTVVAAVTPVIRRQGALAIAEEIRALKLETRGPAAWQIAERCEELARRHTTGPHASSPVSSHVSEHDSKVDHEPEES